MYHPPNGPPLTITTAGDTRARPAAAQGWVCPVCGSGVAPHVERCPCAVHTSPWQPAPPAPPWPQPAVVPMWHLPCGGLVVGALVGAQERFEAELGKLPGGHALVQAVLSPRPGEGSVIVGELSLSGGAPQTLGVLGSRGTLP